jgi:hypothetical protein
MLEDHAELDHLGLVGLCDQDTGGADPEVGAALLNLCHGIDLGAALANFHVEAGMPVEALRQRRVVAGKLKLVLPLELERDFLKREAGACEQ